METIIEVTNLMKVYGSKGVSYKALKEINLKVQQGEFVAIMGPSGSGKTTLLNMMSTIDRPTEGEIKIDGKSLSSLKTTQLADFRRETVGFVFQEFNLLDNMSVQDNIALPLTLNNVKYEEIVGKVTELGRLLGIEDQLSKYPYQLSGGQKQRAAVCRALVMSPKVVFADEPTGALDSKAALELLKCFEKVKQLSKTTIVMVTHDAMAASYCDKVFFIKDGRISGQLGSNGNKEETFKKILNTVAVLGGTGNEHF